MNIKYKLCSAMVETAYADGMADSRGLGSLNRDAIAFRSKYATAVRFLLGLYRRYCAGLDSLRTKRPSFPSAQGPGLAEHAPCAAGPGTLEQPRNRLE